MFVPNKIELNSNTKSKEFKMKETSMVINTPSVVIYAFNEPVAKDKVGPVRYNIKFDFRFIITTLIYILAFALLYKSFEKEIAPYINCAFGQFRKMIAKLKLDENK